MKKVLCSCMLLVLFASSIPAQKTKPWSEWSKKEVEKMLNESAWGQSQVDTDTSEMTFSSTGDPNRGPGAAATRDDTSANSAERLGSGAKNQAISLTYRVRFFSAKPIREAFARMITLSNPNVKATQLQNFVDGDYSEIGIVVAVTYESPDRRLLGPADQAFRSATADILKNKCYLERKDGKRIFLEGYEQAGTDGTGTKFIFPRTVDGQPFLTPESDMVRFVADFGKGVKVERRFKVSDMMYNGKMEY